MKADAIQIHHVVDMMYTEFIKKEQHNGRASKLTQPRSRSLRWIVGTSFAVLMLVSIAIATFFVIPFVRAAPDTSNTSSPANPESSPYSSSPIHPPTLPLTDQYILEELYHATGGEEWSTKVSPFTPVCNWPGVTCDKELRVVGVYMSQNNMDGTIPDSIGGLVKLRILQLSMNGLYGTIPASVGDLTNLVELNLGLNGFNGSVPLALFNLPSLESLSLGYNRGLMWTIPPQVENLQQLKTLELHSSGLHGTIPNEISHLKRLAFLSLGYNKLNGTVPNLPSTHLIELHLSHNQFTGSAPRVNMNDTRPGLFPDIEIDLSFNSFSGEFDLPLAILQHVNMLDMTNNQFTTISARLENVSNVDRLTCNAKNNPFRCPIPEWFKTKCKVTCT
jgi:hypothetical protein